MMPQSVVEQLAAAGAITIPQKRLMALEGFSINVLTGLYHAGEIDSVVIGGRLRRVFIASYLAYLRRRQLGLARDESERLAAIENYQRSLTARSVLSAARARRSITAASRQRPKRPLRQAPTACDAHTVAEILAKATAEVRAKAATPKAAATAQGATDTTTA
jgi:hypothetical protein